MVMQYCPDYKRDSDATVGLSDEINLTGSVCNGKRTMESRVENNNNGNEFLQGNEQP